MNGNLSKTPTKQHQTQINKIDERKMVLNIHTKRLRCKLIDDATDCKLNAASGVLIPATLKEYTWQKQPAKLDTLNTKEKILTTIFELS